MYVDFLRISRTAVLFGFLWFAALVPALLAAASVPREALAPGLNGPPALVCGWDEWDEFEKRWKPRNRRRRSTVLDEPPRRDAALGDFLIGARS